jgi:hypothetical protein
MTKLTNTTVLRAASAPAVAPRPRAASRPLTAVKVVGRTVLVAIEVVQIVGFGLALL